MDDEDVFFREIGSQFSVGCIPWSSPAQVLCAQPIGFCDCDKQVLFDLVEWEELRRFIVEDDSGCFMLRPRVGILEWSRTERQGTRFVAGARLFFEKGDVPWSLPTEKIFNWTLKWIKARYTLISAGRVPIAIGPNLGKIVSAGRAELIYPNGTPLQH